MIETDEAPQRSPYWLSPGIDVPTCEEVLPGMRSTKGLFHFCDEHAEGAFAPTNAFMRRSPTWRLDVLGDILVDLQRAQRHAAVELFRVLSRQSPELALEQQLKGFRRACEQLGLLLPENVEALIVRVNQHTATLDCDGQKWRVAFELLRPLVEA